MSNRIAIVWDFDKTLIPGYMLKRITLREQPLIFGLPKKSKKLQIVFAMMKKQSYKHQFRRPQNMLHKEVQYD